jgi:hypothetical protein
MVIGWWFFLNVMGEIFSDGSPVAYFAHIGGFLTGLLLARGSLKQRYIPPVGGPGGSAETPVNPFTRRTEARTVKRSVFQKGDEPFWR